MRKKLLIFIIIILFCTFFVFRLANRFDRQSPSDFESGKIKNNCVGDCTLQLGIHTHQLTKDLDLLKELNIKTIRTNLPWQIVEPEENSGFVWEAIDEIVDSSEANNIDILFVLRSISTWGTINPPQKKGIFTSSSMPRDMERWKQFVTAVTNRYKDRNINIYYEIENEVNSPIGGSSSAFWSGTIEEYAELLKTTYNSIKQVDSNTFVLASSLACGISRDIPKDKHQWMKDYLANDYSVIFSTQAFDGVSLHNYYFPDHEVNGFTFTSFIELAKEIMRKNGVDDRPIWVTEFGYISEPTKVGNRIDNGSPEKQIKWLSEAYNQANELGVDKMFWLLIQDRDEPYAGSMGLMTETGIKRQVFDVFAELN